MREWRKSSWYEHDDKVNLKNQNCYEILSKDQSNRFLEQFNNLFEDRWNIAKELQ